VICITQHCDGRTSSSPAIYAWSSLRDYLGDLFNMHGASVDQEGNLSIAEVANGRVQKFHPRPGANPKFLVGKPVYSARK
jgi:hypothetical protein